MHRVAEQRLQPARGAAEHRGPPLRKQSARMRSCACAESPPSYLRQGRQELRAGLTDIDWLRLLPIESAGESRSASSVCLHAASQPISAGRGGAWPLRGTCKAAGRAGILRARLGAPWRPPSRVSRGAAGCPPSRPTLRGAPNGRCVCLSVCLVNRSSVAAGSVNPGCSAADPDPSVRPRSPWGSLPGCCTIAVPAKKLLPPAFPPASCSHRAPSPSSLAGGKGETPAWTSAAPTQIAAAGWRLQRVAAVHGPPRSVGLPCPPHATRFPHGRAAAGGGASHEGRAR